MSPAALRAYPYRVVPSNPSKTDPKTIPEDPTGGQTGEQQLKIEFQDASGKKKTLIIEYK